MEPVVLAGMIFSLIVLMLIGGFILLLPLTRRLGLLLENRIQDKRPAAQDPELLRMRESLVTLQEQFHALAERQEFIERLLKEERPAGMLREKSGGSLTGGG